jgi:tellurite resistance protein
MLELVTPAIEALCVAFSRNGYNPTPIIDLGVLVANADGKVDARERETLLDVFQALLDTTLTPEVVDHLVTASLEVMHAAGPESRARLVAEILQDCDAVEEGIVVALVVAFASEGLSPAEREVIERVADAAHLPRERLDHLVKKIAKDFDGDPRSVRDILAAAPRSAR